MSVYDNYRSKANDYRIQAAKVGYQILDDAYKELAETGTLSAATLGKMQTVNKADAGNFQAMAQNYKKTGVLDMDKYAAASIPFPNFKPLPIAPSPTAPSAFVPPTLTGDQVKTQAQTGANTWEFPASPAGRQNDPYNMTAEEMARYAAIGAEAENPSWGESEEGRIKFFGLWQPGAKKVNNKVSFQLENEINDAMNPYKYLTDEEVTTYNALLGRDMERGTSEADAYLEAMNSTLLARQTEARKSEIAQDAQEHPVLSSIASVGATPFKGAGYLYGLGAAALGQEVDPNDPRFLPSRTQEAIRGTVAEEIEAGIDSEGLGKVASFLYGNGMSIADFLGTTAVTQGNKKAALAIMGTGAASDATLSAFDRGATQEQALLVGFLAGAAEIIFEKFSLDHFIKLTNPAVRGAFAKNALKQAGIEASEETLTEIANMISDAQVMGDLSEYNLAIQGHMAQGLTEEEAKQKATKDAAAQVGLAALGGALSGGVTGSVGGAIGSMQNALTNRADTTQAADQAMQAAPGPIEAAPVEAAAAPSQATTWQQAVSQEAIDANRAALRDMASVTTLTGGEFQKGQVGLVDQVSAFFDSFGNKVHNAILGDVTLKRRGAKSSIAHGIGKVKAAAFAAVPSVIENGTVIDYQENWKGRGYDTVVISAPVDIGGEKSYVGAVLIREAGTQRYYLHEVLQEKSTPAPIKTGTTETGSTPSDAKVPSIINILDESLNVNTPKAADKQDFSDIMHTKGDPILMPGVIPTQNEGAAPFKTGTTENGSVPGGVAPSIGTIAGVGTNVNGTQPFVPPIAGPNTNVSPGQQEVWPPPGVISEQVDKLGTKAAAYKRSHETEFLNKMAQIMQIPESELSEHRAMLSSIGMRAIQTGEMSAADKQRLFNQMYQGGTEPGTPERSDAYLQFENAIFDLRKQLNLAQRHEAGRLAELNRRAELKRQAAETPAVVKAYTRQAGLRKAMEKASGMLTEGDKSFAAAMIYGPANLNQVEDKTLRAQIEDYAAKRKAYDENRTVIDEAKKRHQAQLFNEATNAISDSDNWKDNKVLPGLRYASETQERIFQGITKNEASAAFLIETYSMPVHKNEKIKTDMINRMTKEMTALNLNEHEQKYAQMIHEERDLAERIQKSVSGSKERAMYEAGLERVTAKKTELLSKHGKQINAKKAVANLPTAYKLYDELFDLANESNIRNGYAPFPYRKNYLPHFFSGINDPVTKQICDTLGIKYVGDELPTDLAGLTSTFRPGRVFNKHGLERQGTATEFGLYEGFDPYVRTMGDVIYHTDDIQRWRALENAIRYKYSDDGTKARMDEILTDNNLTPEEKQELIEKLPGTTHLSNYVRNLQEYTNILAGKKSIHDRGPEDDWGRRLYSIANTVQGRVSANMVAANLSVATTNLIPLTQARGEVKDKYLQQGMKDTINSRAKDDGFVNRSTFLTNRRGTETAYNTFWDKAGQVASVPFEAVDYFVADTIVRAKYTQNIAEGMNEADAMQNADAYAASLMADRSKGALPTIFSRKNFLTRLFTMFQVETNNQMRHLFKDIPRDLKEKGLAAIANALFQVFLGAYIYGEVETRIKGYKSVFSPFHIVQEVLEGIADVKAGKKQPWDVVEDVWEEGGGNIPFAGGILGGGSGRFPVQAAMPNLWEIGEAWTNDYKNKGVITALELAKPAAYLALPFGGGQLKKSIEGISAVAKGGSFKTDKEGREMLQFETEQGAGDYLQAGLFGKWALPQAREYVEADFPILSANDTAAWREWQASGRDGTDLLRYRSKFRQVEPQKNEAGEVIKTGPAQRRDMLFADKSLSVEDKTLLDKLLIAQDGRTADYQSEAWYYLSTRSEQAYADGKAAERQGISPEIYQSFLNRTDGLETAKDQAGNPIQGSKKEKVLAVIRGLGLTQAQQKYLVEKAGYKWE